MSSAGPALGEVVLKNAAALEDALAHLIVKRAAGTALRAPSRVPTTGEGRLPLAGCRVVTLRTAAQWPPFEDIAVLVACHADTGRVFAARAFAPAGEARARPPAPPDPGDGWTGTSFRIDAAARLGLRLEPGTYALWLLVRGEASGPVRIQVVKPAPPASDDPEVAKFIAAWRARNVRKRPRPRGADPATVWPREAVFGMYPRYRKGADSPPVPAQGISLRAERTVALRRGAHWVLAGSYRIAIPRRHVVLTPVSGDPATAVLPVTLVVTASEAAGPFVRHLRVPCSSPVAAREETPLVEGHFTLNLFSLPGIWRAPDTTYFVYAVCGDAMSEPAVTALVSEAMLAGAD